MRACWKAVRLGAAAAVVVSFWFGWSPVCQGAEDDAAVAAALESIGADDLMRHVQYLADDALEGRQAGTRGGRLAGDYLEVEMKRLALREAGAAGFLQPFGRGFRNILGLFEGTDPQADRRFVIVCAHYDHVGYGTKQNSQGPIGQVHNGADDNASGTAAVLELAEAFARLPRPPRRSILFALWDAEEMEMLGSRHWIDHPTIRLDGLSAVVNFDMIGRPRDSQVTVYGSRTGYGFRRLVSLDNAEGLKIDFSWELEDDADHYTFFRRGIPVLFLHTGVHKDYHSPRDDARLLEPSGMERVVRLAMRIVWDLAERPVTPDFRALAAGETESLRRQVEGTGAGIRLSEPLAREVRLASHEVPGNPEAEGRPFRLGVTFHADDAEPGGVVISSVIPGSHAAKAGLRPGDRIYRAAGRAIAGEKSFQRLAATSIEALHVEVERDGQVQRVVVISGQRPPARD